MLTCFPLFSILGNLKVKFQVQVKVKVSQLRARGAEPTRALKHLPGAPRKDAGHGRFAVKEVE